MLEINWTGLSLFSFSFLFLQQINAWLHLLLETKISVHMQNVPLL